MKYILVLSILVLGCQHAADKKSERDKLSTAQQVAPVDPQFLEFCERWDPERLHPPTFQKFWQQAKASSKQDRDLAFQVFTDPQHAKCWPVATELIGLSGTPAEIERLVNHFENLRPGKWAASNNPARLAGFLGVSRLGLALAASQLGPDESIATRIFAHLESCIHLEYWLRDDHSPLLTAGGYLKKDLPDRRQDLAYHQAVLCMDALALGHPDSVSILTNHAKKVREQTLWSPYLIDGEVIRIQYAIETAEEFKKLGLDEYLRVHGVF